MTFYMDGRPGDKVSEKTKPVTEFLSYLSAFAGDKQESVLKLAQDLKRVQFKLEGN